MKIVIYLAALLLGPSLAFAAGGHDGTGVVDFTRTVYGYLGVLIFVGAYTLVPLENKFHLRKSKPVLMAAGLIWVLIAIAYVQQGDTHTAHEAIRHNLLEYAELFLFLLAAMTYINSMEERNVFQALRAWLVTRGFSLRTIFWITGLLAFFISPVADNLTTALLMGAVVMAVGGDNKRFVTLACINIVVAANAGGAFSPFGDITTLMVWQKGKVAFSEFFHIFIPSVVNWLVPAIFMHFAVSQGPPKKLDEQVTVKYGGLVIIGLFLSTILTAVLFHNTLHLPPAAGMMLGLGYLGAYSYHIKRHEGRSERYDNILGTRGNEAMYPLTAIVKSDKSLDHIINEIPTATFAIDTSHRITHWNEGMERLTNVPAAKAIGTRDHWRSFYAEQRPVLIDLVLNYMPDNQIKQQYGNRYRKNPFIEEAWDATRHFENMGDGGKLISFSACPLKNKNDEIIGAVEVLEDFTERQQAASHFDVMKNIARAEWDTLLFFYGVILCVGGLSQLGYLAMISNHLYVGMGPTFANTMVGILSAIVDNIPVMFAVLTMDPVMSHGQWLLVTLTAGVGGSLLSIGSAAGVALMGTARGTYTFGAHLRWTPIIALGYAASILVHLFINSHYM
jgi:Na+/H+ antiporter NhaD/arsenite permease-like protein